VGIQLEFGASFRSGFARKKHKSAEVWNEDFGCVDFPGTSVPGNLKSNKWEDLLSGFIESSGNLSCNKWRMDRRFVVGTWLLEA
jgi:hypothetical protein